MKRLRIFHRRRFAWVPRPVRRAIVFILGGTILFLGLIMIVAPGPGVLVMPIGLGILALEFIWARRLLRRIKQRAMSLARRNNTPRSPRGGRPGRVRTASLLQCSNG